MDKILVSRGNSGLIDYIKSVRSLYLKYISTAGRIPPSELKDLKIRIATTKDGIPMILEDFVDLIRRSVSPETELAHEDQRSLQLLNSLL